MSVPYRNRAGLWLAAALACGWAWDHWSLRVALEDQTAAHAVAMQHEKMRLSLALSAATAIPPAPASAQVAASACACAAPQRAPGSGGVAVPVQDAAQRSEPNNGVTVIPPGANLLEAIKIIQREQAKNTPAAEAAGVSPFGAPR